MRRPFTTTAALFAAFVASASVAEAASRSITGATLELVKQRLAETATDSWVAGTQMEALLELNYPTLSVFSSADYPPPSSPVPTEVVSLVAAWEAKRPNDTEELNYNEGGAAGDPPSLGVGWLVAAACKAAEGDETTQAIYLKQLQQQVDYLLNSVPRTSDGAISHRPPSEPVQLWSDFVYMVPPFLAYYGIATSNVSLIREAYTQCRLYRRNMRDPSGAWKHVLLGYWEDAGLWNTGNAWAAAGMTRVYATIRNSKYSEAFEDEVADLASWTNEILIASFSYLKPDGLLPNYYDAASNSSFSDAAGSALLAATAYRLAQLDPSAVSASTLRKAAIVRVAVNAGVNTTTGWLQPVVDPLSWTEQTATSPESEAFVLLLQAAWRDYRASSVSLGAHVSLH
ncbi:hypothetical protein JCM6882_009379 [Rhodosporidiobolus microsporus]